MFAKQIIKLNYRIANNLFKIVFISAFSAPNTPLFNNYQKINEWHERKQIFIWIFDASHLNIWCKSFLSHFQCCYMSFILNKMMETMRNSLWRTEIKVKWKVKTCAWRTTRDLPFYAYLYFLQSKNWKLLLHSLFHYAFASLVT